MKTLSVILLAVWVAQVAARRIEAIDKDALHLTSYVDSINADPASSWRASVYPRFHNVSVAVVKRLMGTVLPFDDGYMAPTHHRMFQILFDENSLPKSYDVREASPECKDVIGLVRDQSNCGSCWAFSAVEAFNDRVCMRHGDHTLMSPEDTMSCCTGLACAFSRGCDGGQPSGAWHWFTTTGVVTGGDNDDIGTGQTCKPYTIDDSSGDIPYSAPECVSTCTEKDYSVIYEDDKHYAKSSYAIVGEQDIQQEIMDRGSISVAFMVYEDFMSYSSGVYQYTSGELLGGHAVKMIGWGEDDGTPYWLCVNSWGAEWGENGLFRIRRGSEECGIEDSCVAGEV